jgi:hypothetical protein
MDSMKGAGTDCTVINLKSIFLFLITNSTPSMARLGEVCQTTCCFYRVLLEQSRKLLLSNIQKNKFSTDLTRKHRDSLSLKKIMERKFTFPKTKLTPIYQFNLTNKVICPKMVKSSSTYNKQNADFNTNAKPKI